MYDIDDIARQILSWKTLYLMKKDPHFKGIFADFNKYTFKCNNTGLFTYYSDPPEYSRIRIIFDGFDWTLDSIKQQISLKIKEYKINERKKSMNKDFV